MTRSQLVELLFKIYLLNMSETEGSFLPSELFTELQIVLNLEGNI